MRIGIIGTGQLGRMLALAGLPLGHDFIFYDYAAKQSYDSLNTNRKAQDCSLEAFIKLCDVLTYESENTPLAPLQELENLKTPVYPPLKALEKAQHRFREKTYFQTLGIPTAAFKLIKSPTDLSELLNTSSLGWPLILKTSTEGYDGRGQVLVKSKEDLVAAWKLLGQQECIAEAFISFSRELSIIGCRSTTGEIVYYPLAENKHEAGILRISTAPAPNTSAIEEQARSYLRMLLEDSNYCGILALELFESSNGHLVANEMAPRVHNSGHWSLDGSSCSQFENHIRAITNMPLGDPQLLAPIITMVNFIGQVPDLSTFLKSPNHHVHLYGKEPRPNRKMGHLTVLDPPTTMD
jgi:5-(carboxyamino)imidazole ribonucleotide synthase